MSSRLSHNDVDEISSNNQNNNNNNSEEVNEEVQQTKWLLQQTNLSTKADLTSMIKLNLPNQGLSTLPSNLPKLLPNLSILFMPKNNFIELPAIVGQCPNLQMISFKENGMKTIHPDSLQPQLRWLILTGNSITKIPETIGRCVKLQKLMLSGNSIEKLPSNNSSITNLKNLELVRLACNQLLEPPIELLQLPNLRWVALSNNPFLLDDNSNSNNTNTEDEDNNKYELPIIDDPLLEDPKWPILGQGAGGITREVVFDNEKVAVKTYGGSITSDGSPQDERNISVMAASLNDPCLISLLGQTFNNRSLVMEYLEGYHALAGPPSLDTCTRDVYDYNCNNNDDKNERNNTKDVPLLLDENFCWEIVTNMLRVLYKLHQMGICHGDFYAHNILIKPPNNNNDDDDESKSDNNNKVKLSDFGAAYLYPNSTTTTWGKYIPKIELRAYSVLVEELYHLVMTTTTTTASSSSDTNDSVVNDRQHCATQRQSNHPWAELMEACQQTDATFESLAKQFHVGI